MSRRNHWQHYKVHRQPVGTPENGKITWAYPWQVTRPSNHPAMQGDNWELFAYKRFSSFEAAVQWASAEATRDKLRVLIGELTEENIDVIAAVACRLRDWSLI